MFRSLKTWHSRPAGVLRFIEFFHKHTECLTHSLLLLAGKCPIQVISAAVAGNFRSAKADALQACSDYTIQNYIVLTAKRFLPTNLFFERVLAGLNSFHRVIAKTAFFPY